MEDTYPMEALPVYTDELFSSLEGYDIIVKEADYKKINEIINKIMEYFGKYDFSVRYVKVSTNVSGKHNIFIVVAYAEKEKEEHLPLIVSQLKKIENVLDVRRACRYKKYIYSCKQFPLEFLGTRIIALGPANISAIVNETRKTLGKEVGDLMLYNLGLNIGKRNIEIYGNIIGDVTKLSNVFEFLKFILQSMGWGIIEEYKMTSEGIEIKVKDLWECNIISDADAAVEAKLFQGILSGMFYKILKKPVTITQLKLERIGDHTLCIFKVLFEN